MTSSTCHVHTADPGKILSEAIKYGYLTNFKIENMHEQFLARQKPGQEPGEAGLCREEARPPPASSSMPRWTPSRDYRLCGRCRR